MTRTELAERRAAAQAEADARRAGSPRRPEPAPSGAEAMIEVRALSKIFPRRRPWSEAIRAPFARPTATVLDDVSLTVGRGEFFGLLGPNGAGKTTLFKILSGLILPDAGSAGLDGIDVVADPHAIKGVLTPVIPDERSLYWRLSATENLNLFGALQGLSGPAATRRVRSLLEVVGLADTGAKLVGEFSSGMKQRLLIARALIPEPRILLLDEPTRSLDPISARELRRFLRDELATAQGCTILLATHLAEEAFELCDRLAVLDRGQLLATGTADALRQRAGDNRYQAWIREPESVAALEAAVPSAEVVSVAPAGEAGRSKAEFRIKGGVERASAALAALVEARLEPSRFEPVHPSLADMIERIVAAGRDPAPESDESHHA